jgi:hypothetical protein
MNQISLTIHRQTFLDVVEKLQGTCRTAPRGTLLIVTGQDSVTVLGSQPYSTDYWQTQPSGRYMINIMQGGIRNRELPRVEKDSIKHFLEFDLNEGFCGSAVFTNINGEIVQICIEPRQ